MKRKLFTLTAAASLLLCLGTIWWWTRGGDESHNISLETARQTVRLSGQRGQVLVTRTALADASTGDGGIIHWGPSAASAQGAAATTWMLGYSSHPLSGGQRGTETTLVIPAWLLAATLSIAPLLWVYPRVKRRSKPSHG